jgi:hypothetical protein
MGEKIVVGAMFLMALMPILAIFVAAEFYILSAS